jgi:hypothetical protein
MTFVGSFFRASNLPKTLEAISGKAEVKIWSKGFSLWSR